MRTSRECRGLRKQPSIYERGGEVSVRLSLDDDAVLGELDVGGSCGEGPRERAVSWVCSQPTIKRESRTPTVWQRTTLLLVRRESCVVRKRESAEAL